MTSGTSTSATTPTKPHANDLERWVRNLDDGRVEAVVEGSEEDARGMLEWYERGPIQAEVAAVVVGEGNPEGDLDGFQKR